MARRRRARSLRKPRVPWASIVTVCVAVAALVGGGAFYAVRMRLTAFGAQPGGHDLGERVVVTVAPGATALQVARQLADVGVVADADDFVRWLRRVAKQEDTIKAGTYALSPAMTPEEVLRELQKGTQLELRFTVPEGLRKEEVAVIIADAGFGTVDDLLAAMADDDLIADCGAPEVPGGLDGYLFPDTYQFPPGTPPRRILRRLCARLEEFLDEGLRARMADVGFTLHQTLTLASIIESETGLSRERRRVSAVFHNRLRKGMKLQTDPTVLYGTVDPDATIRKSDLRREHPYNTYVVEGLPPGPICQPGLASIKAALFPATDPAIFFVAVGDGSHEFCPDLECHEAAVARYRALKNAEP